MRYSILTPLLEKNYQIYNNAHNAPYTKKEVVHTIYAQPPKTQTFNNQKNEKRGRPYEINRKICP